MTRARRRRLRLLRCVPALMACLALAAPGRIALAEMTRRYDPVEVAGKHLPGFVGRDLGKLGLWAWSQGAWRGVPFQVDERTERGRMVLPHGPAGRPEDGNGVLVAQDVLVFMVSDVGERAPAAKRDARSADLLEIELSDPVRDERGYVYLDWDPARTGPPSSEPKVKIIEPGDGEPYSLRYRTGLVTGRVNRHGGELFQTPLYDTWICHPGAGGSGQDLLDAMKVRIQAGFLFNTIKVSFDETSILGGIEAIKVGPVRVCGRFWMRGVLPLGIKGPRAHMDVYLYDTMVLVPGQVNISVNPGYVMSSFSSAVGYDLSEEAVGMRFYNSHNPEGFLVDGHMSEQERRMDTRLDEWRAVVGPQGAMITASVWDERYREQADIAIHYEDDRGEGNPPEASPGSIGYHYNLSRVKGLKAGTYDMLLCWFYPDHMYDPERFRMDVVREFLDVRQRPLVVRCGEVRFENPAGWPPMISPE